jgi:glycosyltransferase involved in cell wall biosynthesis
MKILHIVPTYTPAFRYGGPIWSVHGLNRWLVAAGAEVTVFTTNADGHGVLNVPTGVPVNVDGVTVFYFPRSFPDAWFYSRAMRRALAERIREFDVVHITSVFLAASTLGTHYARRARKPYVISPRGSLMRETIAQKGTLKKKLYLSLIERRNLAHARAVHFTTPIERDEYIAEGLPVTQAFILPNGIDAPTLGTADGAAFRTRNSIPTDAKVILSFGRISWKKGFDTLIPAFARVREKDPRAVLVIGGNDAEGYSETIRELVRKHGVQQWVRLLVSSGSAILGEEKEALFQTASVFVLPSYAENFAIVVLEAMQAGKPVIVSENVGLAEDIAEADAGIVIPKDEELLANALLSLLADASRAERMGAYGRELARTRFSWPAIAKQLLALYTRIV